MEDGLVLYLDLQLCSISTCLNPCCNGRWSRTQNRSRDIKELLAVLILVVMEDGLVPCNSK